MSEQIEVEAIKDARDWESQDGQRKLTFYVLDIKKADGQSEEVDHARKQGGSEPQPGEKLDVVFEAGRYRRKMKKVPKEGSFKGTEKSPQVQAQIIRQHSVEMALRYASEVKWAASLVPEEVGGDPRGTVPESFWKLVDQFDADVYAAGQRAMESSSKKGSGASGAPTNAPSAGVFQEAETNKPSLKQLEFLEKLVRENGVKDPELGTLMEWANQTLTPGREGTCSEVIDKLKTGGVPEAERLRETSQNWAKQQLSLSAERKGLGEKQSDDSIPF